MNDLVLLHHNEPMTTSTAIADGVQLQHKNVLALIRKHVLSLSQMGEVAFQTRLNAQGSPTEIVHLNEPQSTLLITFMRNSEIVVKFKVALVKAFFELRNTRQAAQPPARVTHPDVIVPEHEANLVVTADRTYRALIRSGMAAGYGQSHACARAGELVRQMTGVDIHRLVAPPPTDTGLLVKEHMALWKAGKREGLPYVYPQPPGDSDRIWGDYNQYCRARGQAPIGHDRWLYCDADEGYTVHVEIGYAPGGWGWELRQHRLRKEAAIAHSNPSL